MTAVAIPFQANAGGDTRLTELAKGDLLIEGMAIRFDEIDRENERWLDNPDGLIVKAVQRFLKGNAPLCHHHDQRVVLGRCVSSEYVPGVGIRVKAVIDFQEPGSPWRHLYEAARRHRLANYSFGGLFKRKMGQKGPELVDADFVELSICGSSIGLGTSWKVIQEKALTCPDGKAITASGEVIDAERVDALKAMKSNRSGLKHTLQARALKDEVAQLRQAIDRAGPDPFAAARRQASTDDPLADVLAHQKDKRANQADNIAAALT